MSRLLLMLMLCALPAALASAEEKPGVSPMVFIYDSSGSMWGQIDGVAKVSIAREVMAETVAGLPEGQSIGLVAYGHRSEGDCEDVETLLTGASAADVSPALEAIRPLGKTPLAWSATQVITQLQRDQARATVILLTDGIESCGGNLCDVVKTAREDGVEFVMHVVGFGLKAGETDALECAAAAGDGQYFDARNAEELAAGLNEATAQTVDLAVNVSVKASKNGEPIDTYIEVFPAGSSTRVQGARSYRDGALFYLPPGAYDLKVNALENTDLEPIWIRDVAVAEDDLSEHEVSFDAGTVNFNVLNNGEGWDALVKLVSGDAAVAQVRTYGRSQAMQVPPGEYLAQVQALAVSGTTTAFEVPGVSVKAGEEVSVEFPFETGNARVGVRMGTELVDAMVTIIDRDTGKGVAGARTYTSESSNPRNFVLTPGNYTVKYASLGAHKGHADTFDITVGAAETVERVIDLPLSQD